MSAIEKCEDCGAYGHSNCVEITPRVAENARKALDSLRAAEQPPTPPSGRGEERERIANGLVSITRCRANVGTLLGAVEGVLAGDIQEPLREAYTALRNSLARIYADLDGAPAELFAAIDSRDAVIASLVKAMDQLKCPACDGSGVTKTLNLETLGDECVACGGQGKPASVLAALAAARPFTKETR